MKLTPNDEIILQEKGISQNQIEEQLQFFKHGFPFLEIRNIATVGNGIFKLSVDEQAYFHDIWENYLHSDAKVVKFVPASGAASRMFKDLFEFIEKEYNTPSTEFERFFFSRIENFAFYHQLNEMCEANTKKSISILTKNSEHKVVVENLLNEIGLNYGALPKGLLLFHSYPNEKRTSMQEHLVEGALYAKNNSNIVNIHFTVSNEHRNLFEKHLTACKKVYEKKLNVTFNVSFSEQKPSTDTLAVDSSNNPFRENEQLIFRPGGHGALIENLNDIDSDVIFIKNIDNVVPDSMKDETVKNKKMIAGILIRYQQQAFAYLNELENENISEAKLNVIAQFSISKLNNIPPQIQLSNKELREYLIRKLNRPMRVCGMVKNVGEPGGGPFITRNQDGTYSPQILESSQISKENKEIMMKSTHFNPVDLVCAVKNYKGNKFNLTHFVDKNTGFISSKSKSGKELKALELPGLWNGAMSDWNTIFVEVPIETFNPVKTVNDLLRKEHQ